MRIVVVASLLLGVGCTTGGRAEVLAAIERAEDGRDRETAFWERVLIRSSSSAERARAARAVGRLLPPTLAPARRAALARLLCRALAVERDEDVRGEILFALGQNADPESTPTLVNWLEDDAGPLRARAAEALGKLGEFSVTAVLVSHLADRDAEVRGAAALALARLRGRRVTSAPPLHLETARVLRERLEELLRDSAEDVRWKAAYALSEIELAGRVGGLVAAADHDDRLVRLFAARGLSRLATQPTFDDAGALSRLVEDADPFVAASAAPGLAARGGAPARASLLGASERDGRSADFHVRAAALGALAAMPDAVDDAAAPARMVAALQGDPSRTVRAAALVALAQVDPEGTVPRVRQLFGSEDALERVAAAQAASRLPYAQIGARLFELGADEDVRVAVAAMESLTRLAEAEEAARVLFLARLEDEDLALRGSALAGLQVFGAEGDLPAVVGAYRAATGSADVETRVTAVDTAAIVGEDAAVKFLSEALEDPSVAVRVAALRALDALGEHRAARWSEFERSSVEPDASSRGRNPRAVLVTTKGEFELELLADDAPRHAANFLSFAESGRYDGLPFHRIVTGFVAQGLDPRGDGWGTGGVFLRDEINPVPYGVGAVGMPNIGPDSAGCQIFITHVPTPHLDGRYTVFARVTRGMEVVNSLEVGDLCLDVQVRR